MKVYRYATKDEIDNILNGNISQIGKIYEKRNCNTHNYKEGVKYLHFYKNIKSILEIKKLRKSKSKTFCICEFDIPMVVLMLGKGVGYYNASGYDVDLNSHAEYIVPVEQMKKKWLKNYKVDEVFKLSDNETVL